MLYDVVIIGGGPAGLAAGLYAARARLKVLLIEKAVAGGQVMTTGWIENYPGFMDGISGAELSSKMEKHAKKFGLEIIQGTVAGISQHEGVKKVALEGNDQLEVKSIILASGANPKSLNIEGEEKFRGRGVSYCATCDGAFFRGDKVAVIGGGDSAVEEAGFLAKFAELVYVIHRGDSFSATKIAQERAFSNPKLKIIFKAVAEKIKGGDTVNALHIRNLETDERSKIEVKGVFIYVGYKPNTGFLKGLLRLDSEDYILTGNDMSTSVDGIFAAGDVRTKSLKQISTAVGDGATAAIMAGKYIEENF
jgi:thioredoxin reductase (NADPH)